MTSILRQFRRAPGRVLASVLALVLAVGAIGALAIPHISEGALHQVVADDAVGDISVATTPLSAHQVRALGRIPNVALVEGESDVAARLADGTDVRLVRLAADREMDQLRLLDGRQPRTPEEVVVTPGLAPLGATIRLDGSAVDVVGHATSLWWSDVDAVFADLVVGTETNRLVVTAADDGEEELRTIIDQVRAELATSGDTLTDFPVYLPGETTPIDGDIRQVSTLIGLLGIAAGAVAMVLLASTTDTLITERTREVAVMRALGGRRRPLRRRLRRIALAITGFALVVGLPLGVVMSNVIARMVLEDFVGITPEIAVDWRVVAGSAAGMLVGARLVSARAARRVTNADLAAALRDRAGAPFGRKWTHRVMAHVPTGGLLARVAVRSSARRPGRTLAVVAQIATAVGAAFLVASLASSVNAYNASVMEPWAWKSQTNTRDPGLPFAASITGDDPRSESGIYTFGELAGSEIEVFGMSPDTTVFAPAITDGRWLGGRSSRQAVVSAGFAAHTAIEVGSTIELDLASGTFPYEVVGLADDHGVAVYLDRSDLAADAGSPGMANTIWSLDDRLTIDMPVPTITTTRDEIAAESEAGRRAIVAIFGAIGVIVAGVAALAVVSSMTVSLFERRHEFATLRAMGARRRTVRGLLARELVPLGLVGVIAGLAIGAAGTYGIIGSFESSESVDIGTTLAFGALPVMVAVTFGVLLLLARAVARNADRRPIAVTLRGAT